MRINANIYEVIDNKKYLIEKIYDTRPKISDRLIMLQSQWCQDEKPKLQQLPDRIIATSDCDFGHIAFLN